MSMLTIALALVASTATAFTPAPRRTSRASAPLNGWTPDSSAFAYGLPGSLDPIEAFDPWGFSDGKSVEEMKMYREAEVTHGRVSMLATLGFLVQEKAHFLFVEPDKDIS